MSILQASDFPDFTMPRIKRTCLLSRYELRTRRRESPGGFVECVTAWRSRGQDFRFFFKETNNFKSTSGWFSRGRSERKRSKLWASSSRAGIFCFTLFFCNHRSFLFFTPNGNNSRCSSFAYVISWRFTPRAAPFPNACPLCNHIPRRVMTERSVRTSTHRHTIPRRGGGTRRHRARFQNVRMLRK